MIRYSSRIITIGIVILTLAVFAAAQKPAPQAVGTAAKIEQFLKKSPYKVETIEKNIWTVTDGGLTIAVTAEPSFIIVFGVLARKGQYKVTAESMSDMLKYAGQADYIKIVIDAAGDLILRIEARAKGLDQKDFHEILEQVLATSEEANKKLAPHLVK